MVTVRYDWMKGDTSHVKMLPGRKRISLKMSSSGYSFLSSGTIGIFEKESGKKLFSGGESGCRAVIINDPSDTWSHDIKTFSDEIGAFGNATIKVLENGPLSATIRVKTTYGASAPHNRLGTLCRFTESGGKGHSRLARAS